MTLRQRMTEGLALARSLGHKVRGMQVDCYGGYLQDCTACGQWVAAGDDEPQAYGGAVNKPCTGKLLG